MESANSLLVTILIITVNNKPLVIIAGGNDHTDSFCSDSVVFGGSSYDKLPIKNWIQTNYFSSSHYHKGDQAFAVRTCLEISHSETQYHLLIVFLKLTITVYGFFLTDGIDC